MFINNNNHFYGVINGKNIFSFLKFDYSLKTCEERIEFLQQVLEMYKVDGVEFYHSYFDEVYDQERKYGKIGIVIGKDKSQYSESNVAKTLEKLADYILAVDEREEDIKYKIYTSKELFKRASQEYDFINKISRANGGLSMIGNCSKEEGKGEISAFPIFQLPKNYKKVKDLKIEKDDFIKYPPMKDYYDFYGYLNSESKKLWRKSKLTKEEVQRRSEIKKLLPDIKKDIISAKKQLQQPIIWKAPLKDNGSPSWDEFDMFDKQQVKELLRVHKGNDLQDDISCIVQDLNNLIEKIELTERQQKILEMWSDGNDIKTIADIIGIANQNVSKNLSTIVDKIIAQYEKEYADWYYLNICKGEYKKCSKCGEIKLVSEFSKNGDRLRSNCKNCR